MCKNGTCALVGVAGRAGGRRVIVDEFESVLLAGLLADHIIAMQKPVHIQHAHTPEFMARYWEARVATFAKLRRLYESLGGRRGDAFASQPGRVTCGSNRDEG